MENSMAKCGAKTRAGSPCLQPAGWGTEHVGSGRCKLHGGNGGRPPIHGRYATVLKGRLREKFELLNTDEDPLNILPELQVQRTLLMDYLGRFEEGMVVTGESLKIISDLSNDVVNTATKIVKTRNEMALTAVEVKFLQAGIIALLDEFIPDPDRKRAFVARLAALIPSTHNAAALEPG